VSLRPCAATPLAATAAASERWRRISGGARSERVEDERSSGVGDGALGGRVARSRGRCADGERPTCAALARLGHAGAPHSNG
jgi:hypothetical protein